MPNERRLRFKEWFDGPPCRGDRDVLIRKSGLTKGRVSQLFDENQSFGERAARTLAERLGLRSDYFERDATDDSWPFPDIERARYDALPAVRKTEIQAVVLHMLEKAEAERLLKANRRVA